LRHPNFIFERFTVTVLEIFNSPRHPNFFSASAWGDASPTLERKSKKWLPKNVVKIRPKIRPFRQNNIRQIHFSVKNIPSKLIRPNKNRSKLIRPKKFRPNKADPF
jgi:hypothetical protein